MLGLCWGNSHSTSPCLKYAGSNYHVKSSCWSNAGYMPGFCCHVFTGQVHVGNMLDLTPMLTSSCWSNAGYMPGFCCHVFTGQVHVGNMLDLTPMLTNSPLLDWFLVLLVATGFGNQATPTSCFLLHMLRAYQIYTCSQNYGLILYLAVWDANTKTWS